MARPPGGAEAGVLIAGGGITGLTLALALHRFGIPARVFEAAAGFRMIGSGINLLPHGMRELTELGLGAALEQVAVPTSEMRFYNRFGQFVYAEPRGRAAGYDWPQLSIHRGALHAVLRAAVEARLGPAAIVTGRRVVGFEQDDASVTLRFAEGDPVCGRAVIGCDGIHSAIRRQLFPDEGPPVWEGINIWRGVARWKPFLTGTSMIQAGWLDVGKVVVYPIGRDLDQAGRQLINWVAEIRSAHRPMVDWNRGGRREDFLPVFSGFRFDWLDVPGLIEAAPEVLEYPMVDRDPLPWWSAGRVTLVGDAAHPMYPRGANGAGQGILDAATLAVSLRQEPDVASGLRAYEAARRDAANAVVRMNRSAPPDSILQLVHERSGDRPFNRLEDLITAEELATRAARYKQVAGFARDTLGGRGALLAQDPGPAAAPGSR